MSLGFLLPAGLLAVASLLLPLLIHLARRPQHRVIDFAAMRWLVQGERPRRRLRFEDLPLLLSRLALLALLALLLAEPILHGDWRAPRHWVLIDPALEQTRAVAEVSDPEARLRWLVPGFPALDSKPDPAGAASLASLLREFDDGIADADRLTVVVPERVHGLDAQRLALRHAVDWRILPSESSMRVEPSASAPVKVALRHTAHESDALRYLHAVVAAWQESPGTAWSVSEGTLNVPIDADTQWLIWLDAPVPGPVLSWVKRGGRVLVNSEAPANATAIWRNAQGEVIASGQRHGAGRVIYLLPRLSPQDFGQALDADFPERVKFLFAGGAQDPGSDYAQNARPLQSAEPGKPLRTALDRLLMVLVAGTFLLERVLASRRRKSA